MLQEGKDRLQSFEKLHWIKIEDRIIYKILMLIYKSYYNIVLHRLIHVN